MTSLARAVRRGLSELPATTRLAIGFAIVLLPLVVLGSEDGSDITEASRRLDAWSLLILVGASAALIAARRYPGTGVVVLMPLTSVWYQLGHTSGLINPLVLIAFYKLGHTGDRRRQFGIGIPAILIPLAGSLLFSSEPLLERMADLDWPVSAIGWPVIAMLLGEMTLTRRQLLEEYERRAETAESEREAETERRVAEERLHIARDVHDVLAHTVAVMHVQAGVAADTLDRDPEATRRSLDNIRTAGKEAMGEIGATVAVLREGAGPLHETGPAPGLDQLDSLLDATRRAGIDVHFRREPPGAQDNNRRPDGLVQLTVYRVVQEALTNVRRHAVGASRVDVTVTQRPGALVVDIRDNGSPTGRAQPSGSPTGQPAGGAGDRVGYGLRGMRERIEPLGGTLTAGPDPERGWRVHASLPLRAAAP